MNSRIGASENNIRNLLVTLVCGARQRRPLINILTLADVVEPSLSFSCPLRFLQDLFVIIFNGIYLIILIYVFALAVGFRVVPRRRAQSSPCHSRYNSLKWPLTHNSASAQSPDHHRK